MPRALNHSSKRDDYVLHNIADIAANTQHLARLLDFFRHTGPNGTHLCGVFELLGPNVADIAHDDFEDKRLPAPLVKLIAKQTLIALSDLHKHGLGHGGVFYNYSRSRYSRTRWLTKCCRSSCQEHCLHCILDKRHVRI